MKEVGRGLENKTTGFKQRLYEQDEWDGSANERDHVHKTFFCFPYIVEFFTSNSSNSSLSKHPNLKNG